MENENICTNDCFEKFRERIEILRGNKTQKEFAKKIGVSYRTYQNWVNPLYKNYSGELTYTLPNMETALRICKECKVSLDWLMGRTDYKTINGKAIHDITGLSDTAIDCLKSDYEKSKPYGSSKEKTLAMINYLTTSEKTQNVLTLLYHYLFGKYTHTDKGEKSINLNDDTDIGVNGASLEIKDLNAIFLNMLNEQVIRLKNDINENNDTDYGKCDPAAPSEK